MENQQATITDEDARYYEKLELVFAEYEKTFDLEVALDLIPLTPDERKRLAEDELLAARITVQDARIKRALVDKLKNLMDNSASDTVRLAALKEFGRTFYPKRFEDKLHGDLNLNHSGRVLVVDDV